MCPGKKGFRRRYGGTRSLGFKRGTLVRHVKYGLCYIGGHFLGKLCVHNIKTKVRLSVAINLEDVIPYYVSSWRNWYV